MRSKTGRQRGQSAAGDHNRDPCRPNLELGLGPIHFLLQISEERVNLLHLGRYGRIEKCRSADEEVLGAKFLLQPAQA